MAELSMALATS